MAEDVEAGDLFDDGSAFCGWCWDFLIEGGGEAGSLEHWWSDRQCAARIARSLAQGRLLPATLLAAGNLIETISRFFPLNEL